MARVIARSAIASAAAFVALTGGHATSVADAAAGCHPKLVQTRPDLVSGTRLYHSRYVRYRHARHKAVAFGYSDAVARTCSVAYGHELRSLWHFRAHRAYRRYLRYRRNHQAPSGSPVEIGRELAARRGWTGAEWSALYALWNQESGWNPYAVNPTSGACGIAQFLPCRAYGDVVGEITAGLDYIAERYGSPSAAESHELGFGWY
jgi:hypothetical protein